MREIVSVLFDGFETMDVFGPIEILGRLREHFIPRFYSMEGGLITSSHNVRIMTQSLFRIKTDMYILFIPGGTGTRELVDNQQFLNELKNLALKAEYILTVCTGSILFSKTGLMDKRKTTSNKRVFTWTAKESPQVNCIKTAPPKGLLF
jgi:putative intracellular protease/amidase